MNDLLLPERSALAFTIFSCVQLRTLLVALFLLEMDGLLSYTPSGAVAGDAACPVPWLDGRAVGALVTRAHELGCRLRRNVLVVRRLMACHVVLDPVAIWQVAAGCSEDAPFAALSL